MPGVLAKRLRQLDNRRIAQLLEDEVWSQLNLLAPESTICLAAVDRLRRWASGLHTLSLHPARTGAPLARRSQWKAIRDEGVHIMHAEAALYRGGIPHLLLPFQKDRFASNTFMVPHVPEAKACLCQMGFRESLRFPAVLIDRQTGHAVQLVRGS
jgi:hypothetical protein